MKHFTICHQSAPPAFFAFTFSAVEDKCFLSFAASSPCPPLAFPQQMQRIGMAPGNASRLPVTEIPPPAYRPRLLCVVLSSGTGTGVTESSAFRCLGEQSVKKNVGTRNGEVGKCLLFLRLERLEGWFRENFP